MEWGRVTYAGAWWGGLGTEFTSSEPVHGSAWPCGGPGPGLATLHPHCTLCLFCPIPTALPNREHALDEELNPPGSTSVVTYYLLWPGA